MSISSELWELIRAGFPGIWIQSNEPEEAITEISNLAREQRLACLRWNLETGMSGIVGVAEVPQASDPLSAIRSLAQLPTDSSSLLVLDHFHRFMDSAEVVQAILRQLHEGKQHGRHLVIVSPTVKLPIELERLFVVLDHALPTREQLWDICQSLVDTPELANAVSGLGTGNLDGDQRTRLLDAASGLTAFEAESAFSLSLVRDGNLNPSQIWELKARMLRKSGLLSLYRSQHGFESLGGLESLKSFCRRSLLSDASESPAKAVTPRGVLLLGVPGTGKSAFAKALGKETSRPVLCLDIGQLMGSLVGQTEQNIRHALKAADAMAPCVLFVDEVEKALSGVASGGKSDSGVSSRLFGTLLTWLNDHETDVYVVMTCNDIRQLPPEFGRAERFDAIVFLDLPQRSEKDAIWKLYRQEFAIAASCVQPDDNAWTGAEIKACCRLAKLLGISLVEASDLVVPIGMTAAEEIERLRSWASGRCLDASRPGIYRHAIKAARKVNLPKSSLN